MANKPKIKKERTHGEKEGAKREKTTTTLSEKKEEASNVSEQREKDWIHVIRVHDTTHLAVTTTRQGNRRFTNYPSQRKNERSRGLGDVYKRQDKKERMHGKKIRGKERENNNNTF